MSNVNKKSITNETNHHDNYDELKAIINRTNDNFLQKIDENFAIPLKEIQILNHRITSLARSLQRIDDHLQTLETIAHQIDDIQDNRNNIMEKLYRIIDNQESNQIKTNQLHEIYRSDDNLKSKLNSLIEKWQRRAHIDEITNSIDAETNVGCESKIDELISFVHNFGEINRLESSDILNRLSNMQTQFIHFFDAYKGNGITTMGDNNNGATMTTINGKTSTFSNVPGEKNVATKMTTKMEKGTGNLDKIFTGISREENDATKENQTTSMDAIKMVSV